VISTTEQGQLEGVFAAIAGSGATEAVLDHLSPDVELDVSELIDGRVQRGRDSVRAYWEALRADAWAELTMEPESIAERDGVVVALVRFRGRGRRSGVPVKLTAAWVATLRDGLVESARLTLDREAALSAAGVREASRS
jgi:ketosteroid isomerase-like protein